MTALSKNIDVALIGGGIASISLATYLQELAPQLKLALFEKLEDIALESTNGWNNAGTGHAGYAELNYCPENADGSVATERAVNIMEQFEVTRQMWASLVRSGRLGNPRNFIRTTSHMAFVWGEKNVEYMRQRQQALDKQPIFAGMSFSDDPEVIKGWAPLIMEGRDPSEPVAASHAAHGTDVNFGEITKELAHALIKGGNYEQHCNCNVKDLNQRPDKSWDITVLNKASGQREVVNAKFVFIGGGGDSLKLLQRSKIKEARNYGGFPVGGQFILIDDEVLAQRHQAKVYGKAEAGAPPMSVPHLDLRHLNGKDMLLFGPFALFSTKFLKNGSWLDLFKSLKPYNVGAALQVGWDNLHLVKYLIGQAMLTEEARHKELLKYFPRAKREQCRLITAGQRVQIIKKTDKGATLQFGTELVFSEDKTIVALMGASPGASTIAATMLKVLEQSFAKRFQEENWSERLRDMIPSYGRKMNEDQQLLSQVREYVNKWLQLG